MEAGCLHWISNEYRFGGAGGSGQVWSSEPGSRKVLGFRCFSVIGYAQRLNRLALTRGLIVQDCCKRS